MSEQLVRDTNHVLEVIRTELPEDGSWTLEAKIIEAAERRGLSRRAARAALLLLAVTDAEAKTEMGQLWVRWREGGCRDPFPRRR